MNINRKYKPDFNQLLKVLRCEKPDRPVLFEYFTNAPLNAILAGKPGFEPTDQAEMFAVTINAFHNAGYDHVTIPARFYKSLKFENLLHDKKATISQNSGSVITGWDNFKAYLWPDPDDGDYQIFNRFEKLLPPGMKFITPGPGGVLENVTDLAGFELLCYMLYDDEPLFAAMFDAVGSRLLRYYEIVSSFGSVGACIVNDDWGFKTQTIFDPETMEKFVFPWHKKIVDAIHRNGKPAILHSCGNLESVMNVVIDELHYDGKHSFEDAIMPVEIAYEKWGSRIAILGGIDMDFLARSTPAVIKNRAKNMLAVTGSKGYALGSGNSIPPFIPVENYLAMIGNCIEIT